MDETLGKRIVQNRKRMGLTQDQLAERLGVTAQAVSKWENDQSCPDITTLPRLAEIFGITTDALLGVERAVVAELVEEPDEEETNGRGWELHWDPGRRSHIVWALAVLAVGVLTLLSRLLHWDVTFWNILWPVGVLMVGFLGSRFSFFRLGCVVVGAYFLLDKLHVLPGSLSGDILLPALVILFGVALLVDAVKKPAKGKLHITRRGGDHKHQCTYDIDGETFTYNASFGEAVQHVTLSRLSGGEISASFGEFTVDLSGVESISENCTMDASCSFGELVIFVPSRFAVRPNSSTSFAEVDIIGEPDSNHQGTILLNANASFGEICVKYI